MCSLGRFLASCFLIIGEVLNLGVSHKSATFLIKYVFSSPHTLFKPMLCRKDLITWFSKIKFFWGLLQYRGCVGRVSSSVPPRKSASREPGSATASLTAELRSNRLTTLTRILISVSNCTIIHYQHCTK